MLNDMQNGGLRELDVGETEMVSGGGSLGAAWKVGNMIGTIIYDNLSPETQDMIGGTIATAIDNIKSGHPFG